MSRKVGPKRSEWKKQIKKPYSNIFSLAEDNNLFPVSYTRFFFGRSSLLLAYSVVKIPRNKARTSSIHLLLCPGHRNPRQPGQAGGVGLAILVFTRIIEPFGPFGRRHLTYSQGPALETDLEPFGSLSFFPRVLIAAKLSIRRIREYSTVETADYVLCAE